jgi:hypothetical protein
MSEEEREEAYELWPNRTVCSILEDMRAAIKVAKDAMELLYKENPRSLVFGASLINYSVLSMQVEEMQWYANRMEATIGDQKDLIKMAKKRSELKAEIRTLIKQRDSLKGIKNG